MKTIALTTQDPIPAGESRTLRAIMESPSVLKDLAPDNDATQITRVTCSSLKFEASDEKTWAEIFKGSSVEDGVFVTVFVTNSSDSPSHLAATLAVAEETPSRVASPPVPAHEARPAAGQVSSFVVGGADQAPAAPAPAQASAPAAPGRVLPPPAFANNDLMRPLETILLNADGSRPEGAPSPVGNTMPETFASGPNGYGSGVLPNNPNGGGMAFAQNGVQRGQQMSQVLPEGNGGTSAQYAQNGVQRGQMQAQLLPAPIGQGPSRLSGQLTGLQGASPSPAPVTASAAPVENLTDLVILENEANYAPEAGARDILLSVGLAQAIYRMLDQRVPIKKSFVAMILSSVARCLGAPENLSPAPGEVSVRLAPEEIQGLVHMFHAGARGRAVGQQLDPHHVKARLIGAFQRALNIAPQAQTSGAVASHVASP